MGGEWAEEGVREKMKAGNQREEAGLHRTRWKNKCEQRINLSLALGDWMHQRREKLKKKKKSEILSLSD